MAFRTLHTLAILRSLLHLWGKLMEESLEKPRVSIIIPTNKRARCSSYKTAAYDSKSYTQSFIPPGA
jgi:hypothetical protein